MATAISEIKGCRIGILGGTFDPVHYGHLAAARAVSGQLGLDAVLLLPAAVPPHKSNSRIASFLHRTAMLEMAVAAEPDFFVCLIEQERCGPSYTIDTLIHLHQQLPTANFYFIIGSDVFSEIYTWKGYRKLPDQTNLVVLNRPGSAASNSEIMTAYFPSFAYDSSANAWQAEGCVGNIYCLRMPPINISSSQLRQRISSEPSARADVPPAVADYIKAHGLYQRH